jgi:hypothetical protein
MRRIAPQLQAIYHRPPDGLSLVLLYGHKDNPLGYICLDCLLQRISTRQRNGDSGQHHTTLYTISVERLVPKKAVGYGHKN